MFQTTQIFSDVITQVIWNDTTEQLIVYFNNGHVYAYADVPFTMYNRFLTARSKGTFLNEVIKQSCDCVRIV